MKGVKEGKYGSGWDNVWWLSSSPWLPMLSILLLVGSVVMLLMIVLSLAEEGEKALGRRRRQQVCCWTKVGVVGGTRALLKKILSCSCPSINCTVNF